MEAIWNGSIFIPRYASPRNPHGEIPPSPPAGASARQESAVRRALRSWRGRLPENWRAMAGLVNGGMVNEGHALVNAGVIRAAAPAGPWLLDNFNGINGTNITAHTADTGQSWTAEAGGTWVLDGSGHVSKTGPGNGNHQVVTDAGTNAVSIRIVYSSGTAIINTVHRYGDSSHWLLSQWYSNSLDLYDGLGTHDMGPVACTGPAAGDALRVTITAAGLMTFYITPNGGSESQITTYNAGSYGSGNTLHGMDCYFTGTKYDQIQIAKM